MWQNVRQSNFGQVNTTQRRNMVISSQKLIVSDVCVCMSVLKVRLIIGKDKFNAVHFLLYQFTFINVEVICYRQ